jgi:sodium-dependent dicarboxylate transporter 2/3/5
MLILIIYWSTEAIPIPVTSLLPLILFPMVGVLTASEVAPNYFRASFFFMKQTNIIDIFMKYN